MNLPFAYHGYYSHLFWAAFHGALECAQVLLQAKADVNRQTSDGNTPLIIAAKRGHAEMVQLLLAQADIDVHVSNDVHVTALRGASKNRHKGIVLQLLEAKATVQRAAGGSVPKPIGDYQYLKVLFGSVVVLRSLNVCLRNFWRPSRPTTSKLSNQ